MTQPPSVTAYLLGEAGSFRDQRLPLDKPRVVFGRDEQACDIVLAQDFVSRTHAAIETDASGRSILRDLNSRQGTFVNGQAVAERILADNDVIGFGPGGVMTFRFCAPAAVPETQAGLRRRPLSEPQSLSPVGNRIDQRSDAMNAASGSKVRGSIIKVPDSTPGLLFVNGQQKSFTLEGVWISPVAPAANMTVEVEFNVAGSITAITAVDAKQLAQEKLNKLSGAAGEHGKQAAELVRQGAGALAARMGKVALGATLAIWLAWFFLPAVKVDYIVIQRSFTFWELLGIDIGGLGNVTSHGFFSLLGLLAIAAPIAAPFLRHPQAKLLNAMPLAFLALTGLRFWWTFNHLAENVQKAAGPNDLGGAISSMVQKTVQEAMNTMLKATSFGFGAYVLMIAALLLAVYAFKARASA